MKTESVYNDAVDLPTTSLDFHVVKGVEGDCSFTESSLENELATIIASVDSGYIFISQNFIESDVDPVKLERFREIISGDEEDESINIIHNERTTLEEFADTSEEESDEEEPERISCEFCDYITKKYLRCTIYDTRAIRAKESEKYALVGLDNSNRVNGDGLFICTHCVEKLREELRDLTDGLEVILATTNL